MSGFYLKSTCLHTVAGMMFFAVYFTIGCICHALRVSL